MKAISPEENVDRGEDKDQVALESVDQDGAPSLHFQQLPLQHGPPLPPLSRS